MSKTDYNALKARPLNSLTPLDLLRMACTDQNSKTTQNHCWKMLEAKL